MKKRAKLLLRGLLSTYLLVCLGLYGLQNQLLFPAYAAQAVDQNWVPNLSANDTQSMITGQCGQLHVVKWPRHNDRGTIMIFHGNAESIASVEGQVSLFHQLGYSVMAWDYAGYGKSTSCWFNQEDLLRDSEAAYQWLAKQTPESNITLYGRSIGTGLALYVASLHKVHHVLLVSPYDVLNNVAKDSVPFFIPVSLINRFPLDAKNWLKHVQCRIDAIYGLSDALIKPERSTALFASMQPNMHIEAVAGAGHDDITLFAKSDHWLTRTLLVPQQY